MQYMTSLLKWLLFLPYLLPALLGGIINNYGRINNYKSGKENNYGSICNYWSGV